MARILDVIYPSSAPHLAPIAKQIANVLNRDFSRCPAVIDALLEIEAEHAAARRFVRGLVGFLKKRMVIRA